MSLDEIVKTPEDAAAMRNLLLGRVPSFYRERKPLTVGEKVTSAQWVRRQFATLPTEKEVYEKVDVFGEEELQKISNIEFYSAEDLAIRTGMLSSLWNKQSELSGTITEDWSESFSSPYSQFAVNIGGHHRHQYGVFLDRVLTIELQDEDLSRVGMPSNTSNPDVREYVRMKNVVLTGLRHHLRDNLASEITDGDYVVLNPMLEVPIEIRVTEGGRTDTFLTKPSSELSYLIPPIYPKKTRISKGPYKVLDQEEDNIIISPHEAPIPKGIFVDENYVRRIS